MKVFFVSIFTFAVLISCLQVNSNEDSPPRGPSSEGTGHNLRITPAASNQFTLSWNSTAAKQFFEILGSSNVGGPYSFIDFHSVVSTSAQETFEITVDAIGQNGFFKLNSHSLFADLFHETFDVESCASLGIGTENCQFDIMFSPQSCLSEKCSKILLFFSGGQMSCPSPEDDSYMRDYANDGYIAICAKVFETSEGNTAWPRNKIAPRIFEIVNAVTQSPLVKDIWNGDALLFSGVSEGASAPVVTMARNAFDSAPEWKGTKKTGACFFDGIYDIPSFHTFIKNNNCFSSSGLVECGRQTERYGCQAGSPDCDCSTEETQLDSIVGQSPSVFSIQDWKLISCGSGFTGANACSYDATPQTPISDLCQNIDAGTSTNCTFKSLPYQSHITCSATHSSECREWFNTLPNQL